MPWHRRQLPPFTTRNGTVDRSALLEGEHDAEGSAADTAAAAAALTRTSGGASLGGALSGGTRVPTAGSLHKVARRVVGHTRRGARVESSRDASEPPSVTVATGCSARAARKTHSTHGAAFRVDRGASFIPADDDADSLHCFELPKGAMTMKTAEQARRAR